MAKAKKVAAVEVEQNQTAPSAAAGQMPPTPDKQAFDKSPKVGATKTAKGTTKVTFTLHSGKTREFSKETHGTAFAAVADEFHASNEKSDQHRSQRKDHIVARTDE